MVDIMAARIRAEPGPQSSIVIGGGASNSASSSPYLPSEKPILLGKIVISDRVNDAVLLVKEDGAITVSDDRSLRLWLKRDTNQYWPSIHHNLPSVGCCLALHEDSRRLFVGFASGVVSEFEVSEDFNSIQHVKDFASHSNGVQAVMFSISSEWVISCGKDKQFVWQCSKTGRRLGAYPLSGWPQCMAWDEAAKYAFVGDYSGAITILRIQNDDKCTLVSRLAAHTGSITCLAWDAERQLLFSGSNDRLIIMWDIGGKQGHAYEFTAHHGRVGAAVYACRRLLTAASETSGEALLWGTAVAADGTTGRRLRTPDWHTADNCQLCARPFFWNVKEMWNTKTVGLRQHHCRLCGKAVCGACCTKETTYPPMGFEVPVRMCDACHRLLQADVDGSTFDLTPLAVRHQLGHGVTVMRLDEANGRLLTMGTDKTIKFWDVAALLQTA